MRRPARASSPPARLSHRSIARESSPRCRISLEDHWRPQLRRWIIAAMSCMMLAQDSGAQVTERAPSPSEVRLYARLMAMTDSRTWNKAVIDSALSSDWRPLRAAAALGIGQIGRAHGLPGPRVVYPLLPGVTIDVASQAAYALGLLHDSTSIMALTAAFRLAREVAREAAWALGEIGAPARPAIVRALKSPPADDAFAVQLLLAAAKM